MIKRQLLAVFFLFNIITGYAQPTNLDFGTGNLNGWSFEEARNLDSYLMTNGTYSVSSKYALMMPGVLETNSVPITMVSPLGGKFMRIGNTIQSGRSYKLKQTFRVSAASEALAISYAIVAKSENQFCSDKPYFDFVLRDSVGNIIPNSNFYYTVPGPTFFGSNCLSGDPSFAYANSYNYKNWITKNFSLQDYLTTNVTIEFIASGSTDSLGTDPIYAYVDASICNNSFSPNILSVNTTTYNLNQSQNSILVCGTNTATIIAPNSASNYIWTGTGITGLTSQSVAITQAGKYNVVFNNPSACSNTTSVSFTVAENPTLTISSISNTVCSGSAFTMTVAGAKNYTWTPFISNTTGIVDTYFTSKYIVYPYSSSNYTVVGIDTSGCVNSTQFYLTVLPNPILSVSGNTAICIGDSTSFAVSGANTYTWSPGNLSGSTVTVKPTYNTTYNVSGTDVSTGCTANKNVDVLINQNIAVNSLNAIICIGDSIIHTAIGATSYTWSNGVTTNTVVLKPTLTTAYTLSATSVCGITQRTFTITVMALPNVVANSTQTLVCKGTATKLFGSGATSYVWSNSVNNNTNFIPTVTATYTVIGTNNNGCKKSATITLSIVPIATITASSSSILMCLGQTVTLTASGANTYTWTSGETTPTIPWTPTNSGNYNYNLIGKNTFGCISGAFVAITVYSATPVFSFTSSTATVCAVNTNTISIPFPSTYPYDVYICGQPNTSCSINGLVLNPSPLIPTVYSVTATNGCGVVTQTVQVIPQALPVLSLTALDSVCVGTVYSYSVSGADLYYLSGGGGSYSPINTFTANAPTSPAQIFVGIDAKFFNGCRSDIGKYIKVLPNPLINISGSSTLTCSSCTTNLVASGANIFNWNTGATTSNINVSPTSTVEYSIVGTDANGCVSSAKTIVVVQDSLTMCFNSQLNVSGSNLKDVVAADFNGDGKMDIVASKSTYNGLSIYINNGSGVFLPPTNFGPGVSSYGLTASDVNNDGAIDIIVPQNTLYPDIISVYINDGQGNFVGPNNYPQGTGGFAPLNIFSLAAADVTGDGFNEIITGNVNGIVVHKNSGSGTFSTNQTKYYFNSMIRSIHTADLNNDNKLDIIALSESDSTFVFINNGAGGFLPYQKYSSGRRGVVCDVNADGNLDIVSARPNTVSILINNGSGGFNSPINQTLNMLYPWNVSAADFDNDGFEDLAITNYSSNVAQEYIQVLINMKNNSFHSPVNYYPTSAAAFLGLNVLTKDMNSDSRPDLTIINAAKDSILILLNSITPSLTITPQTNTALCAGLSLSLTAMGANTYTWSGGISNGIAFNLTQTQTYTVNANNVSGCAGYAVATVSISPNLSVISSSPYLCSGSSTSILASGADTYSWSNGASTSSVSVSPTTTTVYSVTGSDISTGCSYTKTLSLIVDSCENVWPGDANSDGIADNLDVLELGLHYTQTGFARAIVSNNWQSYPAPTWLGTISNGSNLCYSDCNGDGTINDDDTLAIYINYALTHSKPAQTTTMNPQLSIVPDQAMVTKGTWGTASVYLGDATNTINGINGVAFTVDFDNTLIEPNSIYIEYQNSFLDASQNLHFRKLDFANGKIFTATTHTVNNNVSGFGKIATLHYQILSSLAADQTLNIGLSIANQSDVSGLITPLTSGIGTLMAVASSVGIKEVLNSSNVSVSPNPTSGILNITFSTIPQNTKIEVYNSLGALVLTETLSNKNNTINTSQLSNGMYLIKVLESNRIITIQKIVKQ